MLLVLFVVGGHSTNGGTAATIIVDHWKYNTHTLICRRIIIIIISIVIMDKITNTNILHSQIDGHRQRHAMIQTDTYIYTLHKEDIDK